MKCNHCGKELADGSRFCKYCGKPQAEPTSAAQGEASAQAAASEEKAAAPVALAQQPAMSAAQPAPAAAPAQGAQAAQSGGSPVPPVKVTFGQQFRAMRKILSVSGWAGMVFTVLFGALGLLTLPFSFVRGSDSAVGSVVMLGIAAFCYFFSVHRFWRAAGVECGLQLALPADRTDAEWLAHIRDGFSYEGAVRQDGVDENAIDYLMGKAQMRVTAQDGVLRIGVTHGKRFRSARSGGGWELKESFAADDLLCALAYDLRGEALPTDFVKSQKKRHKDKVGKVETAICVAFIALCLVLLAWPMFSGGALGALRRSTWDNYSTTQTLGEAFDEHFENGKWDSEKTEDGTLAVFTGVMDLTAIGSDKVDVRFEFLITESEDYYYYSLERVVANDQVMPDEYAMPLFKYGFDGDAMTLLMSLV